MAYYYSDPSRETDPHALPDVEVFEHTSTFVGGPEDPLQGPGWYYAFGFPD